MREGSTIWGADLFTGELQCIYSLTELDLTVKDLDDSFLYTVYLKAIVPTRKWRIIDFEYATQCFPLVPIHANRYMFKDV